MGRNTPLFSPHTPVLCSQQGRVCSYPAVGGGNPILGKAGNFPNGATQVVHGTSGRPHRGLVTPTVRGRKLNATQLSPKGNLLEQVTNRSGVELTSGWPGFGAQICDQTSVISSLSTHPPTFSGQLFPQGPEKATRSSQDLVLVRSSPVGTWQPRGNPHVWL